MRQGIDFTWESVAEYMDALGKRRGCNVGTLVSRAS
jgi:N-acyl-D-aspartate/D-glutamate deacylase